VPGKLPQLAATNVKFTNLAAAREIPFESISTTNWKFLVNSNDILLEARAVMLAEADALIETAKVLDESFLRARALITACSSKLVVSGIGKSALVAQKLAATYCSLRIPSLFMHAADGPHGDLGMILPGDVVLFLSLSGENFELVSNLSVIKSVGAKTICITGNAKSTLAQACDVSLLINIRGEAGELAVAPTSSTTAMMGLGDALGLSVAKHRGLTLEEFAFFHPGGSLGKRLLTRVRDLAHEGATVFPSSSLIDVVSELSRSRLGAVAVVDKEDSGRLLGLVTEGDFRRAVQAAPDRFSSMCASEVMTNDPSTIDGDALAVDALRVMETDVRQLSVLPVLSKNGKLVGILRIHDLLSFS
jgi:arabinose-5-phosphate isomerase